MKRIDIATALIMLALCAVVIIGMAGFAFWSDYAPGPSFGPYLIAGAGILLALLLLVEAIREEDQPADWPDAIGRSRVVFTATGLVLFAAALPWLGFLISAVAFMIVLMMVVLRRSVVPSLLTTAVTIALIQGIFVQWLNVRLPTGPLGF
jgi:putative tricarboxylic transport membrane protein